MKWIFLCSLYFSICLAEDRYEESLMLKILNNNQVNSVFNFSIISADQNSFKGHHYELFPRSLGEIIQKYNVAEFHLTMTQGLWRLQTWGYPRTPAPPGAQLWVWFHPDTEDVDSSWYGFTNALSGLLCASLNFISRKETVIPKLSFRPEGVVIDDSEKLLRYALLSRENPCTENLTPWLKLLPCGPDFGISWLLNPAKLHHSRFLTLGLHFKKMCVQSDTCDNPVLSLMSSISTVFDIRTSSSSRPDFSINSLLQRKLKGACPLSHQSLIKIQVPRVVELYPKSSYSDAEFEVYNLKINTPLNIDVRWKQNPPMTKQEPPPLVVHCHIAGYGQQDGGIHCRLRNLAQRNISAIVMHTIPWFLQVYLHTIDIKDQNGRNLEKSHFTFQPAKIRKSPHFMEYVVTIPEMVTAEISIQFMRGFLTWTEHPPDANHGFYIGSTVVTVKSKDIDLEENDAVHRIYTEALQVHIPVPDFSMPYNVICLACTVIAIAFGSLHNLTTRRLQLVDPDKKDKLTQILQIPRNFLLKFSKKNSGNKIDEISGTER